MHAQLNTLLSTHSQFAWLNDFKLRKNHHRVMISYKIISNNGTINLHDGFVDAVL